MQPIAASTPAVISPSTTVRSAVAARKLETEEASGPTMNMMLLPLMLVASVASREGTVAMCRLRASPRRPGWVAASAMLRPSLLRPSRRAASDGANRTGVAPSGRVNLTSLAKGKAVRRKVLVCSSWTLASGHRLSTKAPMVVSTPKAGWAARAAATIDARYKI